MLSLNALNCWKPLRDEGTILRGNDAANRDTPSYWAISSQATTRVAEGSTTRNSSLSEVTFPRTGRSGILARLLVGAATFLACAVQSNVFCFAHNGKVLDPVVAFNAVDVVNKFVSSEKPTDALFHDNAMLSNESTAPGVGVGVAKDEDIATLRCGISAMELVRGSYPEFLESEPNCLFGKSGVFSNLADREPGLCHCGHTDPINNGVGITRDFELIHINEDKFLADHIELGQLDTGFEFGVLLSEFALIDKQFSFDHRSLLFDSHVPMYSYLGISQHSQTRYSLSLRETVRSQDKELGDNILSISKQGDKVIIRTTPTMTVHSYAKGQTLTYESPESANLELLIDKGWYWAFNADDVDKKQADIKYVDAWAKDASEQISIKIDGDVINHIYTHAHASNKGITAGVVSAGFNLGTTAAPVSITKTNVLDYLIDCNTVLEEQDAPSDGRWVVIPTWMANAIKKSDIKDASLSGDATSTLRNGKIGKIDNLTIYTTNNYTAVSDTVNCYNVLFGHKMATTFAAQMTSMETLRNPNAFGDLVRGLTVYGYEVVKPAALGVLYCTKG